jgi:hypothetical protein
MEVIMQMFNQETLAKAKTAESEEELLVLAKESGIDLTEEQAQVYFAQLNPRHGELADEELDNVSGGGCSNTYTADGVLLVQSNHTCGFYQCAVCQTAECHCNLEAICCSCSYFQSFLGDLRFNLCRNPSNWRQ